MDLESFKVYIRKACGIVFDGAGGEKLAKALAIRMEVVGMEDARAYRERIANDVDEFKRLVSLLTINETYFCREPRQIHFLSERLAPRFLSRPGIHLPVRILSAGCSSGEEPYSIVMALQERYGESCGRLFDVTGVDIDQEALAKAREGRYGEFSFRGVPEGMRSRYFDRSGKMWQLKPAIRDLVDFREINLLEPGEPDRTRPFDIVFFRNVSIYFDEETRRRIQKNLAALMDREGVLFTGGTETLANDLGIFIAVEEEGVFYFVKSPETELLPPETPSAWGPDVGKQAYGAFQFQNALPHQRGTLGEWRSLPAEPPAIQDLMEMVRDKRYEEALPLVEERLAVNSRDLPFLLLKAYMALDRDRFAVAEETATLALSLDPWSIDAFVVLGLAAKRTGNTDTAVAMFRRAVYACPAGWPSYYYLADTYRAKGEIEQARRSYRTTLDLLSRGAPETGMRVVPVGFSTGEARKLCEYRLANLNKSLRE